MDIVFSRRFCNTRDKAILSNVLNDYDQETRNFFRWEVYYETTELSELVKSKLGIDFGRIVEIQPIERGVSRQTREGQDRGNIEKYDHWERIGYP